MVGNGLTDLLIDVTPTYIPTLYKLSLIPKPLYDTYVKNDCKFYFNDVIPGSNSTICIDTFNEIMDLQ